MKVTAVSICPSEAANEADRPALTPELLAASGARYSRNNEGLDAILANIDHSNLDKSVDGIFKMVDYGHQSIADMVPVAMFMDNMSIWLAYYLWTLCPTAGGQESSTRYIKISPEGLIAPEELGIPSPEIPEWRELMDKCFKAYQASLEIWESLAEKRPELMGIPKSLLDDTSDSSRKKVVRMKRNYAFDRARCFLPVSAATNVMMIMSARGWVNLCQHLLSHSLLECQKLGAMIKSELKLSAPRMLRHAVSTEPHQKMMAEEFEELVSRARNSTAVWDDPNYDHTAEPQAFLNVSLPPDISEEDLVQDIVNHPHRYAPVGSGLQRTSVRFSWSKVGFAEIRDFNRHRTGTKYSPQVPSGFHFALDQIPREDAEHRQTLLQQAVIGRSATTKAFKLLGNAVPSYVYWTVLGTEYPFEHATTANHFIYESELRTGVGAHYRYAGHFRNVLKLWYEKFPKTKGLILEGSAEPE